MLNVLLTTLVSFTALAQGQVWRAGVNIAGFDFGCDTNGDCPVTSVDPPLASAGGADGISQMQHFVSIGLNTFRLPVAWQYLVNDNLGGDLDETNFGKYDELVQGCLETGAMCILDVHNYARWNGNIVGQSNGAVTNAHLESLWQQLATHYKDESKMVFGVMNEPHDLDIGQWATTVQGVVSTIRTAVGNNTQIVLLPGTDYTSVGSFVSTGSTSALQSVVNNDKTTDNLIFDVHQYLDNDGGTQDYCVTDGTANLDTLGTWLRSNNRQAWLTETGGGSTSSCLSNVCTELEWMYNGNGDIYLGWVGWSAGSFQTSYSLSLMPSLVNDVYEDAELMTQCVMGQFHPSNSTTRRTRRTRRS